MTAIPGDNMTGAQLEADPGFQREAIAQHVVNLLFPGLRQKSPKQYVADSTFLYDLESANTTWDKSHPFNLAATGTPASAAWLKQHEADVVKALSKGDISAARKAEEHYRPKIGTAPLPYPLNPSTGSFTEQQAPGTAGQLLNTLKDLPGATASDAGSALGGVGSLLGKNMVLVVLIVALILVMKK